MTPHVIPITRHLAQENDELRKTVLALVEGIERAIALMGAGGRPGDLSGAAHELLAILPSKGTQ